MSAQGRVAQRRQATRVRIVEAALELFRTQGYEATTVEQITEAADIGKGTFFTHFATKKDVFGFLSEQVADAMASADAPQLPLGERLRAVLDAAADWFEANEAVARPMVRARLGTLGQVAPSGHRDRMVELFATILDDAREAGALREVPVAEAVTAVVGLYAVPVAQWAWDTDSPPLRERWAAQLDLTLHGLER